MKGLRDSPGVPIERVGYELNMLQFQVVHSDLRDHHCLRVLQGQVHVGPETQQTYLRSCVCVGLYHPRHRLGGLSHITGFSEEGGHNARGALHEFERRLAELGLHLQHFECFVVGGTDTVRHVYDSVTHELHLRRLRFRELDILGAFHRKLRLNPAEGRLELFKK
jgi:chemotaxis receptor (MCP) glutamine deamidase CheD